MSSLSLPHDGLPAPAPARHGRVRAGIAARGEAIVLSVPLALLALISLVQLPKEVGVDSWLELVTGRLVAQHGIPRHETLTAMTHGLAWVDQQWLSQLLGYGIDRLGGLGLLGLVNCALIVGAMAICVRTARASGAPFRAVLIILPICVAMLMPSREVRTQAFAVPLFAMLVALLAADSRAASRRVFWVLPLLVLWSNLHGTVTLGAGLVGLHGLVTAWQRRAALRHHGSAWLRPIALMAGPLAALLVTPYGLGIIGYYHDTMVSSTLRQTVTEWQPVTTIPVLAIGVFLVTGVGIWSFGRSPQRTTTWEKLAFLIIALSAIQIVRNTLFLALLAMAVLPVSLGWGAGAGAGRAPAHRVLVNGSIAGLCVTVLLLAAAVTVRLPAQTIEAWSQRPAVLATVQRVTQGDPSIRVLADPRFDDWLLWRDPSLTGRVASDVRYELLTTAQITRMEALFGAVGPDFKRAGRRYRLLVLDHRYDPAAVTVFSHEPGRRILYDDGTRVVILRSAAAAARG